MTSVYPSMYQWNIYKYKQV